MKKMLSKNSILIYFLYLKISFYSKLDRYAASVIDQCFENDRDFAIHLLRREAVAFYKVDSLSLALKANCRAFLASKCVQKHLDNEWYNLIFEYIIKIQ